MGEYVMLGSTAADLLGAAQRIKDAGQRTTTTMGNAINAIDALDVPATFPPDEFTNAFLNGDGKGYHQMVDSGTDAGEVTANAAVKANARQLGAGMSALGDIALNAMWGYTATDDDNATDIDAAAKT